MNPHRLLALLLLVGAMAPGRAEQVDWTSTLRFRVDAGAENPLVLFGFNPQPEPPRLVPVDQLLGPLRAVQEVSGIDPTPFELFLATEGGRFLDPPAPVPTGDFTTLRIPFTTSAGTALTFLLTFTPGGDGDGSTGLADPLFFNPQPEPPAIVPNAVGFLFAFEGAEDGDPSSVGLEVLDEAGDPLPIASALPPAAVPAPPWAPAAMGALLLGAAAVLVRRRRNAP